MSKTKLLNDILLYAQSKLAKSKFRPGIDAVSVSGVPISAEDIVSVCDVALDGWFTEGSASKKFSSKLSDFLGIGHVVLCNSGSSANLLALEAIKEHYHVKHKKVITCSTGFPTTVSPIIQTGLIPYFIDVSPYTLNPRTDSMVELLAQDDVAGIIQAHTLGFPFDAISVSQACARHGKFFIEDACDAMGSMLDGEYVGRFGDVATFSFFPAHIITTGEGGAVVTDNSRFYTLLRSYRDWGRLCSCPPGTDNLCGKRFNHEWEFLPKGYDHKYVFGRVGYNLKMTDLQAALGVSQMEMLSSFIASRVENYAYLLDGLSDLQEHLQFVEPLIDSDPVPFGFPISVVSETFSKNDLVTYLESHNIRTRPVFSGNIIKHPMMSDVTYRVAEELVGSDWVMENTFWIGCHPALHNAELDYVIDMVREFIGSKAKISND